MAAIDLKRVDKALYAPPPHPVTVDVPPMPYLMVDGEGDPNLAHAYREAIDALYSVSYTLKFALKRGSDAVDFVVMPLEGLWWADDPAAFLAGRKGDWRWTAMIRQPDHVTAEQIERAAGEAGRKKELPALGKLRFEPFAEGRAAQLLYTGPYCDEGPAIAELHAFIAAQGGTFDGQAQKHHEIYLGDPRRTAPEKLRTIIRQPYRIG